MATRETKDAAPAPPSSEDLGQALEIIRVEANKAKVMERLLKAAEVVYAGRSIVTEVERQKAGVEQEIVELKAQKVRAGEELADVGRQLEAAQARSRQADTDHEVRMKEFDQQVRQAAAEQHRRLEAVKAEVDMAVTAEREKVAAAQRLTAQAEQERDRARDSLREVQKILTGMQRAGAPN